MHELREVGVRHLEPGQVATRDAHMTRLRDWALLNDAHRIAVVGQGGSGKSTLAQWLLSEVGRGLRPSTRLVFFLQAGDLMRGYRELLAELQRLLGREEKQPDKDEDVRWLVHVLLRDEKVGARGWVCWTICRALQIWRITGWGGYWRRVRVGFRGAAARRS